MAPSMTKVVCIYLLSMSLCVFNIEARESRFFNKEPAYHNPNGGSNTAGYGEGYVTSSDRGVEDSLEADMGNGYRSYRGEGNGEGYVYGNSEASLPGSGSGAGYGEAGRKYPRSGSGRGAEYYSGNGVVNDDSGYGGGSGDEPPNTYATPYPPGPDGGGYGEGGNYGSGYGGRSEKSGAYGSGYNGGSRVTGSGHGKGYEAGSRYGAGSGNGNGEFGANNGYDKETP